MTERIIDLSTSPARLRVRLEQLVIEPRDRDTVTVPLDELAVLVVSHRRVILTHAVLAGIASHGGTFIACDEKCMPAGMMLPLAQHHLQAERFQQQASAALPTKKRVWQQIVRAKVRAQGRALAEFHQDDYGLDGLAKKVRSGDPDNIEGQASRRYWPVVFGDRGFRRERDAEDQNRLLNYGYMVLRAQVSRAICAAGLHPSLGVHHHNRYDAFCLSDDLMEPFRPMVDRAVVHLVYGKGPKTPLDKEAKAGLIGALTARLRINDESRTLFDVLTRTAASLAAIFAGQGKRLALPEL